MKWNSGMSQTVNPDFATLHPGYWYSFIRRYSPTAPARKSLPPESIHFSSLRKLAANVPIQ
jgi:hypothetical protein